eukprot:Seg625.7 transcript_id=Seg625.7/GoldUCD/mRNA.D3Y31 product="hypothetical protein" protein_id=Seg625.7/GoldUCD/D3Y31
MWRAKRWSMETIEEALKAHSAGASLREVNRSFGIPSTTFRRYVIGDFPTKTRRTFTLQEERVFMEWLRGMANNGVRISRRQIPEIVEKVLEAQGRKSNFQGKHPGRDWYDKLLKRHQDIKSLIYGLKMKPLFYDLDGLVASYTEFAESYIAYEKDTLARQSENQDSRETPSNGTESETAVENITPNNVVVESIVPIQAPIGDDLTPPSFLIVHPKAVEERDQISPRKKLPRKDLKKAKTKTKKHKDVKTVSSASSPVDWLHLVNEGIAKVESSLQGGQLDIFLIRRLEGYDIDDDPLFTAWKYLHLVKEELHKGKLYSEVEKHDEGTNRQEKALPNSMAANIAVPFVAPWVQGNQSISLNISLNFVPSGSDSQRMEVSIAKPVTQRSNNAQGMTKAPGDARPPQKPVIGAEDEMKGANKSRAWRKRGPISKGNTSLSYTGAANTSSKRKKT